MNIVTTTADVIALGTSALIAYSVFITVILLVVGNLRKR